MSKRFWNTYCPIPHDLKTNESDQEVSTPVVLSFTTIESVKGGFESSFLLHDESSRFRILRATFRTKLWNVRRPQKKNQKKKPTTPSGTRPILDLGLFHTHFFEWKKVKIRLFETPCHPKRRIRKPRTSGP